MAELSTATPTTVATPTTTVTTPGIDPGNPGKSADAPRMMKIKVDGQEMELSESEVINLAQQGKSSGKRFQEAAATKKEAEQIVNYLKSNPKEAFAKLGIDVRKFSEDTLLELIKQEQMSPEQKRAWENETKLKQYEAGEKAQKEAQRNEQMKALEQQHMSNYDAMFVKALSESGLPKTAYTVKRMAELELVNQKKGLNLEASQLAKIVKEDYFNEHKSMYEALDGDALLEMLGKDLVKKLSKAQLSKYKASKTNNSVSPNRSTESKKASPMESWKAMQKKTRSMY